MRMETSLQGFQGYLADMATASSKVQQGFAQIYNRQTPTTEESIAFTQAFVEEDFAAKLAQAQLKVLKSQDEMLGTVLDLESKES